MKRAMPIALLIGTALAAGCGGGKAVHSSPNGSIVFAKGLEESFSFFSPAGIYRVDPDGSHAQRLTRDTGKVTDFSPAWSPDGKSIAFIRRDALTAVGRLYVMSAAGHDLHAVAGISVSGAGLGWSPDSKEILFAGKDGVFAVSPSGGDARVVVRADRATYPSWSPNGKAIAFDQHERVFFADADGMNMRRLTHLRGPLLEEQPSWSPDGRWIAYVEDNVQTRSATIKATKIDGSDTRTVVWLHALVGTTPTWSPDGNLIAFADASLRTGGIRVARLYGSQPHFILEGGGSDPNWGPARP